METQVMVWSSSSTAPQPPSSDQEEMELRRGPWTVEEDLILINYIENHGEGRWNSLARCSGLKRTGKSCRLRWLNYLRPDVRRGNITPEEQLLILELHSRWGNRWSKIAQHMPGRTDNEIKNFWRTRVQKYAKQLECDVNSEKFKDVMHYLWMPRLIERIRAGTGSCPDSIYNNSLTLVADVTSLPVCPGGELGQVKLSPDSSSSDSVGTQFSSPPASDCFAVKGGEIYCGDGIQDPHLVSGQLPSHGGYGNQGLLDLDQGAWGWDMGGNLWNVEDIWF